MSDNKTHYRKVFNSPYLSSADIVEPTVLTVAKVTQEKDHTKKTKDSFNTAYFAEKELRKGEPLKPMILNAINSETMRKLTGSHYVEDWSNIAITVYVDSNVRFGRDTVEGLRISTEKPRLQRQKLTPESPHWQRAKDRYKKDGNLEAVLKSMDISDEHEIQLKEEVENEG